jgi:hypothetical protein
MELRLRRRHMSLVTASVTAVKWDMQQSCDTVTNMVVPHDRLFVLGYLR